MAEGPAGTSEIRQEGDMTEQRDEPTKSVVALAENQDMEDRSEV